MLGGAEAGGDFRRGVDRAGDGGDRLGGRRGRLCGVGRKRAEGFRAEGIEEITVCAGDLREARGVLHLQDEAQEIVDSRAGERKFRGLRRREDLGQRAANVKGDNNDEDPKLRGLIARLYAGDAATWRLARGSRG